MDGMEVMSTHDSDIWLAGVSATRAGSVPSLRNLCGTPVDRVMFSRFLVLSLPSFVVLLF